MDLASGIVNGIALTMGIWVACLLIGHFVVSGVCRFAGGMLGGGDSRRAKRLSEYVLPAGTLLSLVVFVLLRLLAVA